MSEKQKNKRVEADQSSVTESLVAQATQALEEFETDHEFDVADELDQALINEGFSAEIEAADEEYSDVEEILDRPEEDYDEEKMLADGAPENGEEGIVDLQEEEPLGVVAEEASGIDSSATEGTELEAFESAEIEEEEFLEDDEVASIVESILFATDKPQSVSLIKQAFKGTNIQTKQVRRALDLLATEYAGARRGVTLEEVNGGYQLRTKVDNMVYLKRMLKIRTFRISGPALEVLSIVAYKQPCIKSDVDAVRGVESGHLMRGLLDRGMLAFAGKSDLPGKPMYYQTTRKFLETFGLRNLKELPSLSEIDELIPEGIDNEEEKKTLDMLTEDLSTDARSVSYSEGEEELGKITDKLSEITTTSDFFEQEKQRQKDKKEAERANDIRERMILEEEIEKRDAKWLERYEAKILEREQAVVEAAAEEVSVGFEKPVGGDLETAPAPQEEVLEVGELEIEGDTFDLDSVDESSFIGTEKTKLEEAQELEVFEPVVVESSGEPQGDIGL